MSWMRTSTAVQTEQQHELLGQTAQRLLLLDVDAQSGCNNKWSLMSVACCGCSCHSFYLS